MEKIDILVRFANEGTYYNTISVDPKKIKNPMIFIDEVFITIDCLWIVSPGRVMYKRLTGDQP